MKSKFLTFYFLIICHVGFTGCSNHNAKNMKEIVIGCYPFFQKKIDGKMTYHYHAKKGQDTININHCTYQQNGKKFILEPTFKKNILNIQTEDEKDIDTYMLPNTYDRAYIEGVPEIDAIYNTHKNILKILKKGGELHIQDVSSFPNYILKDSVNLIGPFIWHGTTKTLFLGEPFKFENENEDLDIIQPKRSCLSSFLKKYICKPAFNISQYCFPWFTKEYLHKKFTKKGKQELFENGISPFLDAINNWILGYSYTTYKLANGIELEFHKKNSEEIISKYFQSIGYSSCQFKYPKDNIDSDSDSDSEYKYVIIAKK